MQQPSWTACQLRESILLRSQATDYGTLECAILTRDANLQFWRLRRAVPLHSAKFQLSVISASVAVLCPVLFGLGRRLCCQNCCQRHASDPSPDAATVVGHVVRDFGDDLPAQQPTQCGVGQLLTGRHRLAALFVLAVTTGMREGELLPLKWTDIGLMSGANQVRRNRA